MNRTKLPSFRTTGELVDFFDSHDMGEYELPEAHFEVGIEQRKYLLAVDRELMRKLTRMARASKTSTEELVNALLSEKAAPAR